MGWSVVVLHVPTCAQNAFVVHARAPLGVRRRHRESGTTIGVITLHLVLPGGVDSPRLARRFLDEKLPELGFVGDASVVQLLASELVSNAVRHGEPPFVLTLDLVGGRAKVTVTDHDAEHLPAARADAATDRTGGGRGLHIVDELADDWGCDVHDGDGKAVWFSAGPS
jgi:anti-sigma regulatory factor (Ser/Thr protein kinase)